MAQHMVEHQATVTVNAPVHQVYTLFSHFNDFPKFMSFVKEVTYYDDQRSHWVAEVAGEHEWDAVNDDWIPDQQICWHAVSGLNNRGRVLFQPAGERQTHVDVLISYDPPAGPLGTIGEHLGIGRHFEEVLQNDLNHFARMVDLAPTNAEDPSWSQHLFNPESAAAQGKTTARQNATMGGEFSAPEATHGVTMEHQSAQPAGLSSYTPDIASTPSGPDLSHPDLAASDMPATTASARGEDTFLERPILDRDIINEPTNAAPLGDRQAMTLGNQSQDYPGIRGTEQPFADTRNDEPQLPPEQMPPYRSEGEQPQQ